MRAFSTKHALPAARTVSNLHYFFTLLLQMTGYSEHQRIFQLNSYIEIALTSALLFRYAMLFLIKLKAFFPFCYKEKLVF